MLYPWVIVRFEEYNKIVLFYIQLGSRYICSLKEDIPQNTECTDDSAKKPEPEDETNSNHILGKIHFV